MQARVVFALVVFGLSFILCLITAVMGGGGDHEGCKSNAVIRWANAAMCFGQFMAAMVLLLGKRKQPSLLDSLGLGDT